MGEVIRDMLTAEFATRKRANPLYSLRAFAAALGADHSTLSQVMKGVRRATVQMIRRAGNELGLTAEEITVLLVAEHAPDPETRKRQSQLTHWAAEGMAVLHAPVHFEIVRLSREPRFRNDCRWLARQTEVGVDDVNLALTRLLRLELIDGRWRDSTGLAQLTERGFRKLALDRIRQKAAEDGVKFVERKR